MKLYDMMQFKSKLEKKRQYFNLPNLPDREWMYMLQKAKMEGIKKNEFSPFYSFMCSTSLSLGLSTAIVLAFALLLLYLNPNGDSTSKINTASSYKTNIDVVNVSNSSFI